jgi:hypothetical protein
MKLLSPTVNDLLTFSATIGLGVSFVKIKCATERHRRVYQPCSSLGHADGKMAEQDQNLKLLIKTPSDRADGMCVS